MNAASQSTESVRSRHSTVAIAGFVFALALVSPLVPMPQPATFSGQHWRVELLSALFLIVLYFWGSRRQRSHSIDIGRGSNIGWFVGTWSAFVGWSLFSTLWAIDIYPSIHHTLAWAVFLSLFLILIHSFEPRVRLELVIITLSIAAVIIGFVCMLDFATITDFSIVEGPLRIRYAKFAELLLTCAPLLWVLRVYARSRLRSALITLVAACAWGTAMLSLSKGAFIAGVGGFLLTFATAFLFSYKGFRKKILIAAALWIVATVGFQAFVSTATAIPATTSYISGAKDQTRETSVFRIFVWKVSAQMIWDNPLFGVGADNFGVAFNKARASFAAAYPDDPQIGIAEDFMVERAHNEPLQMLAELGIFGFAIAAFLGLCFVWWCADVFRRRRWRLSPVFWASVSGMLAFTISSLFSSFSFRLMQNGLVFVLVMTVAATELLKSERMKTKQSEARPDRTPFRIPLPAAACVALGAMLLFSASRAASDVLTYTAETSGDDQAAAENYRLAVLINPDNASAYYSRGMRFFGDVPGEETSADLRKAIDLGLGTTVSYSFLSKSYGLSGNQRLAERALTEALNIYPRSIFARVRYAVLLKSNGRTALGERHLAIARSYNARQANGWNTMLTEGSLAAFNDSRFDPMVAPPVELTPFSVVHQYLDKNPVAENLMRRSRP